MYMPSEHEEIFNITPIGVRYICEFCNNGEMIYVPGKEDMGLYPHKCDKCDKTMMLPKIYPYIEWNKE